MVLLAILFSSAALIWFIELCVAFVRSAGIREEKNVISAAIQQSLSIVSRVGVFGQQAVIALILDKRILMDSRAELGAFYSISVLLVIVLGLFFSKGITEIFSKITGMLSKRTSAAAASAVFAPEFQRLLSPNIVKHRDYFLLLTYFLYYSVVPAILICQRFAAEYSATLLAISTIVNGVGTIIVIWRFDMRLAIAIENSGDAARVIHQALFARLFGSIASTTVLISYFFAS